MANRHWLMYKGTSDYFGSILAFEHHRDDGEVVHVMCSAKDADGGPAATGSVPYPSTWLPVVI